MRPVSYHNQKNDLRKYVKKLFVSTSLAAALVVPGSMVQAAEAAKDTSRDHQVRGNMSREKSESMNQPIKSGNRALVGRDIRDQDGKTIGEIENVVLGINGQLQYVIARLEDNQRSGAEEIMVPLDKLRLTKNRGYVYYTGTEKELGGFTAYGDYGWAGRSYDTAAGSTGQSQQQRQVTSSGDNGQATVRRYIISTQQDQNGSSESDDLGTVRRYIQNVQHGKKESKVEEIEIIMRSPAYPMGHIYVEEFGPHGVRATQLIGKKVRNKQGERLGPVSDMVMSPDGDLRLLLSVGEALGMEDKVVQADLADVRKSDEGDYLIYDVSREELRKDPAYSPEQRTAGMQGEE